MVTVLGPVFGVPLSIVVVVVVFSPAGENEMAENVGF